MFRANWDRHTQEVEPALSKRSLPSDCQSDEKIFRTVILKAASHHIPTRQHILHEEPVGVYTSGYIGCDDKTR